MLSPRRCQPGLRRKEKHPPPSGHPSTICRWAPGHLPHPWPRPLGGKRVKTSDALPLQVREAQLLSGRPRCRFQISLSVPKTHSPPPQAPTSAYDFPQQKGRGAGLLPLSISGMPDAWPHPMPPPTRSQGPHSRWPNSQLQSGPFPLGHGARALISDSPSHNHPPARATQVCGVCCVQSSHLSSQVSPPPRSLPSVLQARRAAGSPSSHSPPSQVPGGRLPPQPHLTHCK